MRTKSVTRRSCARNRASIPSALEIRRFEEASERVAQRLAPLREGGGDDLPAMRLRRAPDAAAVSRRQAHDRRFDLGHGLECRSRDLEQLLHLEAVLQHHRQPSVVAGRRARPPCAHDFFLQHDVNVADARRRGVPGGTAAASKCCRAGCRRRAGAGRARQNRIPARRPRGPSRAPPGTPFAAARRYRGRFRRRAR